ncbi:hypothetical protein Bca4012_082836 [Brassica carinata]|uniref:Uncharacterized protein n=1 Tax=Brassica carinata TaxID=52824 RepID=A0A8X7VBD1_BRACI|nr:hypothetical protein Bca52824_027874 [Brassica carinata]
MMLTMNNEFVSTLIACTQVHFVCIPELFWGFLLATVVEDLEDEDHTSQVSRAYAKESRKLQPKLRLKAAGEGVNPQDTQVPPFIVDMEGKAFKSGLGGSDNDGPDMAGDNTVLATVEIGG